ncbi:MAG: hypothetical protein ABIR91_01480 [Candidatus Saccharimonadales bacterium]
MPAETATYTDNHHQRPIVIRSSTDKQAEIANIKLLLPVIQKQLRRRTLNDNLGELRFHHAGIITNGFDVKEGKAIIVGGGLRESVQTRRLERVLTGHYYIDLQGRLLRCAKPDASQREFAMINLTHECLAVVIYLHAALKEFVAQLQPSNS